MMIGDSLIKRTIRAELKKNWDQYSIESVTVMQVTSALIPLLALDVARVLHELATEGTMTKVTELSAWGGSFKEVNGHD